MEAAQSSLSSSWILKFQKMSDLKKHEDNMKTMLASSKITSLGRIHCLGWGCPTWSCLHRIQSLAAFLYYHLTDGTKLKRSDKHQHEKSNYKIYIGVQI